MNSKESGAPFKKNARHCVWCSMWSPTNRSAFEPDLWLQKRWRSAKVALSCEYKHTNITSLPLTCLCRATQTISLTLIDYLQADCKEWEIVFGLSDWLSTVGLAIFPLLTFLLSHVSALKSLLPRALRSGQLWADEFKSGFPHQISAARFLQPRKNDKATAAALLKWTVFTVTDVDAQHTHIQMDS